MGANPGPGPMAQILSERDELAREVEQLRLENRRLLQATLVDPATGLPNRAAFEADHLQLDARRRRHRERYAALLIGLDRAADLGQVAPTVAETIRQGDRAYRMGPAELAVLLPGAGLREALAAGERILAAVGPGGPVGADLTVGATSAGRRHEAPQDVITELEGLVAAGRKLGGGMVVGPA